MLIDNVDLPVITGSRLINDLRELGILPGETVMLHASVKAIGWVVGGPDTVILSLLDALTPKGTLVMFVGWEEWEKSVIWLERSPKEWQEAYQEACPPFDPQTSRAMRKWSILTEYLRTWPGAVRSDHPTASVVAVGSRARWMTEDHPLCYGYGARSPFEKMCEAGGKVLLLGSPLKSVTLLHHAEHMAKVPGKRVVHNRVPVLRDRQREWVEFEEYDTCEGIRDRHPDEYFEVIVREFLSTARGTRGKVGAAESYLLDAAELARFAMKWMERIWGG